MIRVLAATERQAQAFMSHNEFSELGWKYCCSLKEILSLKSATVIALAGWETGCYLKKLGQKAKLKRFSMTNNNTVIYAEHGEKLGD